MKLEEKSEELLETLWIHTQERKRDSLSSTELEVNQGNEPLSQLVKAGCVSVTDSLVRPIYVRLGETEPTSPPEKSPRRWRWGWWRAR